MDIKELRLGSIVEYKIQDNLSPTKEYFVPIVLDIEDFLFLQSNPNNTDYRYLEITADLLLNIGFNRTNEFLGYYMESIAFNTKKEVFVKIGTFEKKIKYFHELQDIFKVFYNELLTFDTTKNQ